MPKMIERAILKRFDQDSYYASVQLVTSLTTYLDVVKVARNIPATEMTLERNVLVAMPDNNPKNAAVIAVFDP